MRLALRLDGLYGSHYGSATMSPKNPLLAAALVGVVLAAATVRAVADGPATPAPAAPSPAPSPPTVLLLSHGDVVHGTITETDDGYLAKTPIGVLPFRRSQVERAFGSLREVYEYKLARLPGRDVEERMKLVQWCLAQRLTAEASQQLDAVLKQDPDNPRARQMRFWIQANAGRTQTAPDQAVVRTSAEKLEPPAPVDSKILHELRDAARKNPLRAGRPIIFDLPEALAVKRYQAFCAYVHPALQRVCASCHNEQANNSFQLVQARSKRDLDNELLVRANLDATLRLIDPSDPPRSLLLSSAIMPHRPSGRPVLTGPNDPTYRLLLSWVDSLRSSQSGTAPRSDAVTATSGPPSNPAAAAVESGFAAGRLGGNPAAPRPLTLPGGPKASASADASAAKNATGDEVPTVLPKPPGQILPGSAAGLPRNLPPPDAFPTSPLLDGPNPAKLTVGGKASREAPAENPKSKPGKTIKVPGLGEVPVVDTRDLDAKPDKNAADADSPAKKKPPKINPDALQQFMAGSPAGR